MLCDRGMILLMCGPLTKACELLSHEGCLVAECGRTKPFLMNILQRCSNFAATVHSSVIMAYHYLPNNQERLYLFRSYSFP
jgi:hypothetical protein